LNFIYSFLCFCFCFYYLFFLFAFNFWFLHSLYFLSFLCDCVLFFSFSLSLCGYIFPSFLFLILAYIFS
jgi:hypothetical protein